MATVSIQQPLRAGQGGVSHRVTGAVTGNVYIADGLGRVTVDVLDAPNAISKGYLYTNPADAGGGGLPNFGTAVVDFGAFPGKPVAEATVNGAAIDLNAILQVQVVAVASVDHSADEHAVDPPMVSGQVSGNTIILRANCSGRDRPVPPGIPFGQVNTSQMPIPRRQPTPYGKWNVAWAFVA